MGQRTELERKATVRGQGRKQVPETESVTVKEVEKNPKCNAVILRS